MTNYSLVWINVDVKWLYLEQFELKEPKILVACFVVVLSQAIIVLQWLCESKFKMMTYMKHQLIRVCTNT